MLATILPERIGARVEIPNDDSGLMAKIEAHGFFADHIDGARIIMSRKVTNETLRGSAVIERAKLVSADLARRVRILPA